MKKVKENDTVAIDTSFRRIKFKSQDQWKVFLTKVLNVKNKSAYQNKKIMEADSLFFDAPQIKLLVDYNKYGKESVLENITRITEVENNINNKDFKAALIKLRGANKNLIDNRILDLFSTAFYNLKMYDSSIHYLNKINTNKFSNLGRYHLIKGLNYLKLDSLDKSCKIYPKNQALNNSNL